MKLSYHIHSTWSDGKASIEEIVHTAKKSRLDEIGISDHFVLSPNGLLHPSSMPLNSLDDYINEIKSFSSTFTVRVGLEADFFPQTVDELSKILSSRSFDYIIGSVHNIDGITIDSTKETLPSNFCNEYIRKYWVLIKQMAESKQFDIVGHIDLTKKFGFFPKEDLSKEIDEALQAIVKSEMTIELNTSGWFYPCQEQYPSQSLLEKCFAYNIPIVVSSDAHIKENLSRNFDTAYQLLHQNGYRKQARYKNRKRSFTSLPISY